MASSWPTTRSCSLSSICSSLSRSPCIILAPGCRWRGHHLGDLLGADLGAQQAAGRPPPPALPFLGLGFLQALFQLGQLAVLQLGHLVEVALAVSSRSGGLSLSISSLPGRCPGPGLLGLPDLVQVGVFRCSLSISSSISSKRFCEASSFLLLARPRARSCSWIMRRSSLSMTSGLESISILILAAASSIRSIALSGRKRSVM
jgi:hypothetical protein